MSRLCRVLLADDAADGERLKNALAVLLPLDLPEPRENIPDIETLLAYPSGKDLPLINDLIDASRRGEFAVQERFHDSIREPFGLDVVGTSKL